MGESEWIEPRSLADEALLRGSDDLLVDFDRAFRMFQEFVRGCRALYDVGLAVTVFGSARFDEDHRYCRLARELAHELLLDFVWNTMFREGAAEEGEVSGFLVANSPIEAADHIERVVRARG